MGIREINHSYNKVFIGRKKHIVVKKRLTILSDNQNFKKNIESSNYLKKRGDTEKPDEYEN